LPALQCSEQDSNLQQRESRSRASAGVGLPEHCRADTDVRPYVNQWTPEGIEPSFPGCKPGVFPLDDGPMFLCHVAGRIRTFSPGLRRAVLVPVELPQRLSLVLCPWSFVLASCFSKGQRTNDHGHLSNGPGRIRTCTNLILSQAPLPIGLLNRFSPSTAPGRTRTRIRPLKRRRLCR
jgi:hypothetical protein